MANKIRFLFFIFISICLSGCGFSQAMSVQNDYATGFGATDKAPLELNQDYKLETTRGLAESKVYAFIPKGIQYPVASSDGRVFYQSPNGFEYSFNGEVRSRVGGVVQVSVDDFDTFYVWYFHSNAHDEFKDYFEVEPNGVWIDDVKPGILNILERPWVESDLVLYK